MLRSQDWSRGALDRISRLTGCITTAPTTSPTGKYAGINGLEVLKQVREKQPDVGVIMLSVIKEIPVAVQAIQLGALPRLAQGSLDRLARAGARMGALRRYRGTRLHVDFRCRVAESQGLGRQIHQRRGQDSRRSGP